MSRHLPKATLHPKDRGIEHESLWLQFERNEHQLSEFQRRLESVRQSTSSERGDPIAGLNKAMIGVAVGLWLIMAILASLIT